MLSVPLTLTDMDARKAGIRRALEATTVSGEFWEALGLLGIDDVLVLRIFVGGRFRRTNGRLWHRKLEVIDAWLEEWLE